MPNFLSLNDFSKEEILSFVDKSLYFKYQKVSKQLISDKQIFIANLFFEDSTRTHNSFIVAERKIGLEVLDLNISTSSVNKGESLFDTALTLKSVGAESLVIRHSQNQYYNDLLELGIPIINAGDGNQDHPSQTLLDLVTIKESFETFDGLKIGIVGDIAHSRVAHSNMKVLKKLGSKVYFSGPKIWYDKDCDEYGEYVEIDNLVQEVDVLNLLRVQNERLDEKSPFSNSEYLEKFGLNQSRYNMLNDNAIIIHPAPINRDIEWESSLVMAEKSRYPHQMENGVFARMAILNYSLGLNL